MFHNKIDRAKTLTLLHIFYCVISVLTLVIYHAINGFTVEYPGLTDNGGPFYIGFMFIVYLSFCFAWCINGCIALLGISKKKHKLLKYYLIFGITIMILSTPLFVGIVYLYSSAGRRAGWDLLGAFSCRDFGRYLLSFSVLMFFGTLLSALLLYFWYQIKRNFQRLLLR